MNFNVVLEKNLDYQALRIIEYNIIKNQIICSMSGLIVGENECYYIDIKSYGAKVFLEETDNNAKNAVEKCLQCLFGGKTLLIKREEIKDIRFEELNCIYI